MIILWELIIIFFISHPIKSQNNTETTNTTEIKYCAFVDLIGCNNGTISVYRNQNLKITCQLYSCKRNNYSYHYHMINWETGDEVAVFGNQPSRLFLTRYTLTVGNYLLTVSLNGTDAKPISPKCIVEIKCVPVHAVLKEGFERYVGFNTEIILDASASVDYNQVDEWNRSSIIFSWIYSCQGCGGFITAQEKGEIFRLKPRHEEETFHIKLELQSKFCRGQKFHAHQIIYVRDNVPEISIDCTSNCFVPFDFGNMTLVAKCKKNCRKTKIWIWNLYVANGDIESLIEGKTELNLTDSVEGGPYTEFGQSDVTWNNTYLMTASYADQKEIAASFRFKTYFPRPIKEYITHRKPPTILETYIKARWTAVPGLDIARASIFQYDGKEAYLMQYELPYMDITYVLPFNGTLTTQMVHYSGYYQSEQTTPDKMQAKAFKPTSPADMHSKFYDDPKSIAHYLDGQATGALWFEMTHLARSISVSTSSDVNLTLPIIESMEIVLREYRYINIETINYIAFILRDITSVDTIFTPLAATNMSNLCKQYAEHYWDVGADQLYETRRENDILYTIIINLMKCSFAIAAKPNLELVKPKEPLFSVEKLDYTHDYYSEVNTETYDQYLDEKEALEHKKTYKSITYTFIETCVLFGMAISRRLERQSKMRTHIEIDDYAIDLTQVPPLPAKLKALGVKMVLNGTSFKGSKNYSVVIGVTKKNIFWWDSSEILTDILIVKIWKRRQLIRIIPYPATITFEVRSKPEEKYPMKYPSGNFNNSGILSEEEESLLIYIISVPAGASLCVEFMDLENTTSLTVLLTDFKLPTLDNFVGDNVDIVDIQNPYVVSHQIHDYYGYRLIGVLNKEDVHFKMRAYAVNCAKWIDKELSWLDHCEAIFLTHNSIECSCTSTSTLIGTLKDNPVREWQTYTPFEAILEEQYCYIVSIFMGFLLLLYGLLLCFCIRTTENSSKTVYFLGDIQNHSRFGYLVVINTGHRLGAGTTSNVTIKLHGKNHNSEPHVLNYPDPNLNILQRGNEDWFLLATNFYLGTLVAMELWFDGIGALPSWYCSTVQIMDVQQERWYAFKVSRLFDVYRHPKIYYKVAPSKFDYYHSFKRRLINLMENYSENFRVFNLSWRETNENLSYVKRLTMMLSAISSMSIWCIFFYGFPSFSPTDSLMLFCEYRVTSSCIKIGILASCIVASYHIPITHIFRSAKIQFPYDEVSHTLKQPLILTFVCWGVVIILVFVNFSLVIFAGTWIPYVTACLWMTSILIGTIFYVLVIETLYGCVTQWKQTKVMQSALFVKSILSKIITSVEYQRSVLYKRFGPFILRPLLTHLYRPLNLRELQMRWLIAKLKFQFKESIETCIMSLILVLLAVLILKSSRDHSLFDSNEQVKHMMEHARGGRSLHNVRTMNGLISYINETLIDVTHSKAWYGKFALKNPGMTEDYVHKVVGVIRIRQHRSVLVECKVPKIMRFLNRTCYNHVFDYQPQAEYGEMWNSTAPPASMGFMKDVWKYTSSDIAGPETISGDYGTYPGGGYVAFLGRGKINSYLNMDYLEHYSWFDDMSRCIIIEFLLYNGNSNIFNAVRFIAEQHITGYLGVRLQVLSSKPLQMSNENVFHIFVLLYVFIVLVIFFTIRTICRIYTRGLWFLKDLWHILDFIIIFLCFTYIGQFYFRSQRVAALLESLEGSDPKDFVNHYDALNITYNFTIISSLLIAFATIKMWAVYRLMSTYKIVERTFIKCFIPLCAIIFWNLMVVISLVFSAYSLFIDATYKIPDGFITKSSFLLLLHQRPFDSRFYKLLDASKWAYLIYVLYALFLFIFWCIYASLFIFYYHKARIYFSNIREIYTAKDYVTEQAKFHYNLLKIRLKCLRLSSRQHFQGSGTPLNPKSNAHRFANTCTLSLTKLRAMSLITLCILRNAKSEHPKSLSEEDIRLMTYTLLYLRMIRNAQKEDEEKEWFYKCHLENKLKLIPEWRMTKIQAATLLLLGESKLGTMAGLHMDIVNVLKEDNAKQLTKIQEKLSTMLSLVDKIKIEDKLSF